MGCSAQEQSSHVQAKASASCFSIFFLFLLLHFVAASTHRFQGAVESCAAKSCATRCEAQIEKMMFYRYLKALSCCSFHMLSSSFIPLRLLFALAIQEYRIPCSFSLVLLAGQAALLGAAPVKEAITPRSGKAIFTLHIRHPNCQSRHLFSFVKIFSWMRSLSMVTCSISSNPSNLSPICSDQNRPTCCESSQDLGSLQLDQQDIQCCSNGLKTNRTQI